MLTRDERPANSPPRPLTRLITPITFIISLFTDNVNIYAVPNSGNWYDFGYVLGLMVAFSGPANQASAAGRRRSKAER